MADADIWMPIYWGHYFADTLHLTTEQHGCYFLLMGHYWRKGPPPDNDGFLASVVKLSKDAWIKNREILAEFFQIKDGKWRHKRIEAEKADAIKNSRFYRRRAMAGAEARWGSNASSMQEAPAELSLKDAPSPSPSPSPVRQRKEAVSDEEFISALKANKAYKGIDIDKELGKMDAWLLTPKGKGRRITRQFILNWLNKCDADVSRKPGRGIGKAVI